MSRHPLSFLVIIVLLILSLVAAACGGSSSPRSAASAGASAAAGLGSSSDATLVAAIETAAAELPQNLANGTKLGKDGAKIKLVEYQDFQCPFCLAYTAQQEPTLIKEYVATGKMQITYKTYPLLGTESVKAGEAALCAADQNKFWPYKDKLFLVEAQAGQHSNEQRDVGRFSDANLKQLAADLGLDSTKFNICYDSGKFADQVNSEYSEGKQLGISGVPEFVINGTPLTGTPSSLDSWRQALDRLYAATSARIASPSPATTPALTVAPSTASPSLAALTGLGLTTAAWGKLHKEDTSKNPGEAYDRQVDGTDRFAAVNGASGIITGFTMQYTLAISASAVTAAAVKQLPSDAVLVARAVPGECELLLYKSAALGSALADPKIGAPDGYVGIVITDSAKALDGVPFDDSTADEAAIELADASFTQGTC